MILTSTTKPENQRRGLNLDSKWSPCTEDVWNYASKLRKPVMVDVRKDGEMVTFLKVVKDQTQLPQGNPQFRSANKVPSIEDSARLRRRTDCFIMAKDLVVAGIIEFTALRECAETFNKIVEGEIEDTTQTTQTTPTTQTTTQEEPTGEGFY